MASNPQFKTLCAPFPIDVRPAGALGNGLFVTKDVYERDNLPIFSEDANYAQRSSDESLKYIPTCATCTRILGPFESLLQDTAKVAEGAIKPESLSLLKTKMPELPDPLPCEQEGCSTQYCSEECRDDDIDKGHGIICKADKEAYKKFVELDAYDTLNLGLAAKIIARVIHKTRSPGPFTPEAVLHSELGRFHPDLGSIVLAKQHLVDQKIPPERQGGLVAQLAVKCRDGIINPCMDALKVAFKPSLQESHEEIFTQFDKIIGTLAVNVKEYNIHSPLFKFADDIKGYISGDKDKDKGKEDADNASDKDKEIRTAAEEAMQTIAKIASKHGGDLPVISGTGLFDLYSVINHSCQPNCVSSLSYDEATLAPDQRASASVYPLKDIKEGTQIVHSYITLDGVRKRVRRMRLWPYGFTCMCPGCENECAVCGSKEGDPEVTCASCHIDAICSRKECNAEHASKCAKKETGDEPRAGTPAKRGRSDSSDDESPSRGDDKKAKIS